MPIENERKFIIYETDATERKFAERSEQVIPIKQRYLITDKGKSGRIRQEKFKDEMKYSFTFKMDCDIPGEVVEIETAISPDDFNKLWFKGTGEVTKVRYKYQGWDVDFFKYFDRNYIAIAEIELPSGVKQPTLIPALILENLIYQVPMEDKRFSNKKIGNLSYAISLLDELKVKSSSINKMTKILKKKYY